MKRRKFIKTLLASGVVLVVGGTTYLWVQGDKNVEVLTIEAALKKINVLTSSQIKSTGKWSPYQIFSHCAQSIEFSMQGCPKHKSSFFKNTLGKIGISVFKLKGSMQHNLSETIPGAADIQENDETSLALVRLNNAFVAFDNYQGELKPHFAYGHLSKQEYMFAHVMHLNNHLEEIFIQKA